MDHIQAVNAVRNIVKQSYKHASERRCRLQINEERLVTDAKTGYLCPVRIERLQAIIDALYARETVALRHLADLDKAA